MNINEVNTDSWGIHWFNIYLINYSWGKYYMEKSMVQKNYTMICRFTLKIFCLEDVIFTLRPSASRKILHLLDKIFFNVNLQVIE